MQEALAFLAPRMPGLALADDPGYESVQGIYGLSELALRWEPPVSAPTTAARSTRTS